MNLEIYGKAAGGLLKGMGGFNHRIDAMHTASDTVAIRGTVTGDPYRPAVRCIGNRQEN
jgi:hypothetical protein